MSQALINFHIDEDLKHGMEQACKDMGLTMTTAFTIFATKVSKERRIPFDLSADPDPFFSETNLNRLQKAIADVESGKSKLTKRELIEVSDDEVNNG